MNRLFSFKSVLSATVALGAVIAASAAHARSDVFLSIGLPGNAYVQSQPIYVQPQPVYVQPQSVYVQPQGYYGQQRYVERRGPYGDEDRDGILNAYDRDYGRNHGHRANRYGPYGDLDRDGVPNRFDRFPQNPYRR